MGYLYDSVQKMRACSRPLRSAKPTEKSSENETAPQKVSEPVKEASEFKKKTVKKAVKENAETDSGDGKQP